MSDREALKIFARQPVSHDMIAFLADTTNSIIQVKQPVHNYSKVNGLLVTPVAKNVPLVVFIKNLIKYSNVQTPTLMATVLYLNKLRNILPANAVGMESTRHRIFLAALILSAKSLNDSSPLNKHWTKYTDGLLTLEEVNMAERELMGLLKWQICVKEDELIIALQPFLSGIKRALAHKLEQETNQRINYYRLSNAVKHPAPASRSSSNSSISSYNSTFSMTNSSSSYSIAEDERIPLGEKSCNTLNVRAKETRVMV